jgi:aspartate/methionine/tyrosine aminotransferase
MDKGIPLIHDAAYYTHSYLPDSYELGSVGDVQIFSTSKMFGLSGFRVGYAVCHNEKFAPLIQNYMETMTVGASSLSQQFLFHLFQWEKSFTKDFTNSSYSKLLDNKNLIKQINPLVLEVPDDFEKSPGMFGFFKKGPKANFAAAKVNVVDGKFFGKEGFVRLSLGLPHDRLKEVVDRLNNL